MRSKEEVNHIPILAIRISFETLGVAENVLVKSKNVDMTSFSFQNITIFSFIRTSAKLCWPLTHCIVIVSPDSKVSRRREKVGRRKYSAPSWSVLIVKYKPCESTVRTNVSFAGLLRTTSTRSANKDERSAELELASISAQIEDTLTLVCFLLLYSRTCNISLPQQA